MLFVADSRGRLLHPRGPVGAQTPPPRFFLGRSVHGSLWRFAADLPERLVAELARLAAGERASWPLERPPERSEAMRARLAEHAPIVSTYEGPAFRFPDAEPAAEPDPDVVALTPERVDWLGEELASLRAVLGLRQPCFGVREGGLVRSVCYAAARTARAAEAGVETLPGFRGRGFASRAVRAWAQAVRAGGALPLYSTEWRNRSSLGVAARLGLIRYGVDLHFR